MGLQKNACRLLAVRLSPEIVEERRWQLRDKVLKKDRTVSAISLAWLEWSIYITNVPPEWRSLEQVFLIYRLRWQIELLFKLWKSECQLDRIAGHIKAREIYAKLIGSVFFQDISLPLRWTDRELSPVKQFILFVALRSNLLRHCKTSTSLTHSCLLCLIFDNAAV